MQRSTIPYPPAQVWAAREDFKAHAEWGPLNDLADGETRFRGRKPWAGCFRLTAGYCPEKYRRRRKRSEPF